MKLRSVDAELARMLEADRMVRWALGASPLESIDDAGARVRTARARGVAQPAGAYVVAEAMLADLEGWALVYHAAAVATAATRPRLVQPTDAAKGGGT